MSFTCNFYSLLENEMDNYRLFKVILFFFTYSYILNYSAIQNTHFRASLPFISVYHNGNIGVFASWRSAHQNCFLPLFFRPSALIQKRENKLTKCNKICYGRTLENIYIYISSHVTSDESGLCT